MIVKKAEDELDKTKSSLLALDTVLQDPPLITLTMNFCFLMATWFVRLVDPARKHPHPKLDALPLPKNIPETFSMLPEFFIEDLCESVIFTLRTKPKLFNQVPIEPIAHFCLVFLSSTHLIKNPYLKAKLVEILFMMTWQFQGQPSGGLAVILDVDPTMVRHLMPALIRFYVGKNEPSLPFIKLL